uniref:NF-kappa-B inhibitor cactus n=1 Tax=Cacopsylla melanoneura TaxID=428564 RepID=A0A8D8XTI1_9HEMI
MDNKASNQQLGDPSYKLAPTFSRMNSTKSEMSDKDFTDSSKTDSGCVSDYISTGSMSDLDLQHDTSKHLLSRHPLDSGLLSEENIESEDNYSNPNYKSCTHSHPSDSSSYSQKNIGHHSHDVTKSEQFDSGYDVSCELEKVEKGVSNLDIKLLDKDEYWKQCYTPDENGDLPLHLAVIDENREAVHHLVQVAPTAVCLDVRNDLSQTALLLTVLTNQPHLTRHLILCNANYTKCDHYARTPLHWAVAEQNFECVKALTSPVTVEELNAITGVRLQKRTCLRNETVNLTDAEGMTCVHLAATTGNMQIMEHLINHGGDVNTREWKSGMSALHIAVERQDKVMVEYLLSLPIKSINVDIETFAGFTPYQICYDDEIRTMLEEAGADKLPHAEDEHDMSMDETSDEEDEEEISRFPFQETSKLMAGMV